MEISQEILEQVRVSSASTPDSEKACPRCHALIPVYVGFITWCSECDWNLEAPSPNPFESRAEKLFRSIVRRSSGQLFRRMVAASPTHSHVSPSTIAAFLLAGLVHSITLAFVFFAFWLVALLWPHPMGFALAALSLGLAWLFLPGLPALAGEELPRAEFPELYRLTDQIAAALGSARIDGIVIDPYFNAAYGQFGWRQRRILILGLPLLSVLNPQEKVALLSHELAHSVNGDPQKSFIIGGALHTLDTWYGMVHPGNRPAMGYLPMLLLNMVSYLLIGVIWIWVYALLHMLWRESQRAEYLADYLAAQVSGTETQLRMLEKVHLQELFNTFLTVSYLRKDGANFFHKFQARINKVPPREIERIKRIDLLSPARLDTSHPPIGNRVEFLEKHYVAEAKVTLTPEAAQALDQELRPLQEWMQEHLFKLDSQSFRSLFGLNW